MKKNSNLFAALKDKAAAMKAPKEEKEPIMDGMYEHTTEPVQSAKEEKSELKPVNALPGRPQTAVAGMKDKKKMNSINQLKDLYQTKFGAKKGVV